MSNREGDTVHTDVLVAGSGPIGCTFARCLVLKGRSVFMVDSGAQHSARPGEHLKNAFVYQRDVDRFTPIVQGLLQPVSVPTGGPSVTLDPISFAPRRTIRNGQNPVQDPDVNLPGAAVAYGVGGMFTHWTSNTPRHHAVIERYAGIENAEWEQIYMAAEQLLEARTDIYEPYSIRHNVVKGALADHYAQQGCVVDNLPVAGHRRTDNDELIHFSGADTILGPLLNDAGDIVNPLFTLRPEHRLTRLVVQNGKVVYAEVEDLVEWRTRKVIADQYVVAAGSLLTPQILWNSNVRPAGLGRYLTEHPMTFTQVVLGTELVRAIETDERFTERVRKVAPNDPVKIPMNDPPPMVRIPVAPGREWHCQVHRDSFAYGQLPPSVDDRLIVDLRWFGRTDVNEDNRLSFLDGYNDKFGMPKPLFNFRLSDGDRSRAHDMMTDMIEAAQVLGGFLPGAEPRFMPAGSALHFMGTYRMGRSPEEDDSLSVVDTYSRVWGMDNLVLGGNGVIPTSTACNPTLTSIALAVRAAGAMMSMPTADLVAELARQSDSP